MSCKRIIAVGTLMWASSLKCGHCYERPPRTHGGRRRRKHLKARTNAFQSCLEPPRSGALCPGSRSASRRRRLFGYSGTIGHRGSLRGRPLRRRGTRGTGSRSRVRETQRSPLRPPQTPSLPRLSAARLERSSMPGSAPAFRPARRPRGHAHGTRGRRHLRMRARGGGDRDEAKRLD